MKRVCEELQTIPELQNGFNAVGFSQGMRNYGIWIFCEDMHAFSKFKGLICMDRRAISPGSCTAVPTLGAESLHTHNSWRPAPSDRPFSPLSPSLRERCLLPRVLDVQSFFWDLLPSFSSSDINLHVILNLLLALASCVARPSLQTLQIAAMVVIADMQDTSTL